MEFGFGAGGDHSSTLAPSSAAHGYFASQALRAGLVGDFGRSAGPAAPPPSLAHQRDALQRELLNERFREENLLRDITAQRDLAHREIIQQELRRDLELRRWHDAPMHPVYPDHFPDRAAPFTPEAGLRERLDRFPGPRRDELGFDERVPLRARRLPLGRPPVRRLPFPLSRRPGPGFAERGRLLPRTKLFPARAGAAVGKKLPPARREKAVAVAAAFTKGKIVKSGLKRKAETAAADNLNLPPAKRWNCVLCEISTTSKQGLEEHMQGKKHKLKEEESLSTDKQTTPGSTSKKVNPEASKIKESEKLPGKDKPVVKKVAAKAEPKPTQHPPLWCDVCKVQCNSDSMLKSHLAGKRHQAQLEESKNKPVTVDESKDKSVKEKPATLVLPAKKISSKGEQPKPDVKNQPFWCDVCKVQCNSQPMLDSHLGGKRHKAELEGPKDTPVKEEPAEFEKDKPEAPDGSKDEPEKEKLPAIEESETENMLVEDEKPVVVKDDVAMKDEVPAAEEGLGKDTEPAAANGNEKQPSEKPPTEEGLGKDSEPAVANENVKEPSEKPAITPKKTTRVVKRQKKVTPKGKAQ